MRPLANGLGCANGDLLSDEIRRGLIDCLRFSARPIGPTQRGEKQCRVRPLVGDCLEGTVRIRLGSDQGGIGCQSASLFDERREVQSFNGRFQRFRSVGRYALIQQYGLGETNLGTRGDHEDKRRLCDGESHRGEDRTPDRRHATCPQLLGDRGRQRPLHRGRRQIISMRALQEPRKLHSNRLDIRRRGHLRQHEL